MRHYILGNGPSLTADVILNLTEGKTWGVNRIWRVWNDKPDFLWRPDFYVRCEVPKYKEEDVREDLQMIAGSGATCFIQKGFRGIGGTGLVTGKLNRHTSFHYFETCVGEEPHDWHLPEICGYGTVVHVAAQLAVLQGASEIVFVGCDLGTPAHFYGDEGDAVDDFIMDAHKIATRSCPIPIYDAGTSLTCYPCLL
jgi:hypothetical protein